MKGIIRFPDMQVHIGNTFTALMRDLVLNLKRNELFQEDAVIQPIRNTKEVDGKVAHDEFRVVLPAIGSYSKVKDEDLLIRVLGTVNENLSFGTLLHRNSKPLFFPQVSPGEAVLVRKLRKITFFEFFLNEEIDELSKLIFDIIFHFLAQSGSKSIKSSEGLYVLETLFESRNFPLAISASRKALGLSEDNRIVAELSMNRSFEEESKYFLLLDNYDEPVESVNSVGVEFHLESPTALLYSYLNEFELEAIRRDNGLLNRLGERLHNTFLKRFPSYAGQTIVTGLSGPASLGVEGRLASDAGSVAD